MPAAERGVQWAMLTGQSRLGKPHMTEDEAKGRWCPFANVSSARRKGSAVEIQAPSFNRVQIRGEDGVDVPKAATCIGENCMAWRWDDPWTSRTEEGQGGDIVIRLKRKPGEPRQGFCGLAGALR